MPRTENEESKGIGLEDSEPSDTSTPRPEQDSSPRPQHNLESHSLTAREQLMIQWPLGEWERR